MQVKLIRWCKQFWLLYLFTLHLTLALFLVLFCFPMSLSRVFSMTLPKTYFWSSFPLQQLLQPLPSDTKTILRSELDKILDHRRSQGRWQPLENTFFLGCVWTISHYNSSPTVYPIRFMVSLLSFHYQEQIICLFIINYSGTMLLLWNWQQILKRM